MFYRFLICSFVFIFLALLTNNICIAQTNQTVPSVEMQTSDGYILLKVIYTKNADVHQPVILLPMLGKTIETYKPLIPVLKKAGYNILAIDMRGHGKSIHSSDGKIKTYKNFTNEDWKKLTLDIDAAIKYLQGKNLTSKGLYLIGASIGANTAIVSAAKHTGVVSGVIALSPGLDYHGVKIGSSVTNSNPYKPCGF